MCSETSVAQTRMEFASQQSTNKGSPQTNETYLGGEYALRIIRGGWLRLSREMTKPAPLHGVGVSVIHAPEQAYGQRLAFCGGQPSDHNLPSDRFCETAGAYPACDSVRSWL
jgi:hypothetical protein